VSARHLDQLDMAGVQMACLCYLEPGTFANARYLVRRLRRRLPKAEIIAGFWTLSAEQIEQREALTATGVDLVVNLTQKAIEHIVHAAKESPLTRSAAIDPQTGVEIFPAAVA
jgi:hypothetical protein